MNRRLFPFFLAIIVLAVMTLPALAKPNSSATVKATFDLASSIKVGSTTLVPGHYDVVADGNKAKFVRNGKTVAEIPCDIKDLPSKSQQTGFSVDHDQLVQIHVSGKTQAIDFSANPASGN